MSTINPDTGEAVPRGNSPRFVLWLTFFAFSTIVMGSAASVKKEEEEASANSRWAVFCSSFSFATTGVVVLMHLSPIFSGFIVGTKVEGILTIVLAAFWSATVSVVANASTGLAVDSSKENTIVNGNLYYFSWAGFVTSILLVISYLRGVFGVDVYGEVKNRSARLTQWSGLLACQLVVMGACANILDKNCSGYEEYVDPSYCQRTKFGITVGALGTIVTLGVVAMKMLTQIAPLAVEGLLSLFLAVMNGLGVTYLTSPAGPGSAIGNLYYFSWLSFLCCFMLLTSIWEAYNSEEDETNDGENKEDDEVPADTIAI
jgi:hypothetical protein